MCEPNNSNYNNSNNKQAPGTQSSRSSSPSARHRQRVSESKAAATDHADPYPADCALATPEGKSLPAMLSLRPHPPPWIPAT